MFYFKYKYLFLKVVLTLNKRTKHATNIQSCQFWIQFVKRCFYKPKYTDKNELFFKPKAVLNKKNIKNTYV